MVGGRDAGKTEPVAGEAGKAETGKTALKEGAGGAAVLVSKEEATNQNGECWSTH